MRRGLRNEDGFVMTVGFVGGVHQFEVGMSMKGFGMVVVSDGKRIG